MRYLRSKLPLNKNSSGTIYSTVVGIRGFIPFPRILVQKGNTIVWLEFELLYFGAAVQHLAITP